MKQLIVITGSLIWLLLNGCCVYQPQPTDIPLIRHKNDLRIDAGISSMPGIHSTLSYGLTKKIALQVFGSYGSDKARYFQVATGIYKAYENRKVLELYGGFGAGYGDAYRDANPGHLSGPYRLYFLQGNAGKYSNKSGHFEYGLGIKTGILHTNLTDHNYYNAGTDSGPFSQYKENSLLLEPMVFLRVGGEKVKFSFKIGGCKIFKFANPDRYIPTSNINIGLGISFSSK
jgi:hypothetical protein